jgi:hypothetical protein
MFLYHYPRSVIAGLLLAVLSSPLAADDVSPEIAQAIADLSSDVFLTREKASERLLAAGAAAIEPLEAAAARGELETTARALAILEQLVVDAKLPADQDAALAAVKRLAAAKAPGVAARATALVEAVAELRRTQAIARLTDLGARFESQTLAGAALLPTTAQYLEIGPDWTGDDGDLKALAMIYDLQAISFSGEQVTDVWLAHLTDVPSLRTLKLKRTKVTAVGIRGLKELKELTALDLFYFPVDDEAIRPLADMRQLSRVRLYGTEVSKAAAAKLTADLPTTTVDVRRGGFLGIGIEPHPLGCIIARVEIKSMAARAGLEPGDIILSIAGERPGTFEELTKVIGRFEPGEEIALQLYRDGERETLKIKLGEWE